MATYSQIQVLRSDAIAEIITKNGTRERNSPTIAQQNTVPDANGNVDCYKKLDDDKERAIDWRRKLGGMLMHRIGREEHRKQSWIIQSLPEGYELWEHVKYNVNRTAATKEKGKHAGGGYERQDAYLYGHPDGRKKRYRSPADFFPHLLWLIFDEESDPRNCSCKICSPDGDDDVVDFTRTEQTREIRPVVDSTPRKDITTASIKAPTIPQISNLPPTKPAIQSTGPKRSKEQIFDSQANGPYIYRPGELVWFNKGTAWGLGVISKRQAVQNGVQYLLQQLSHPFRRLPYQVKENHDQLRPWLAWSTPALTHVALTGLTYEQVRWDMVMQGRYGNGDAEVDSSILAARLIDSSYSLFDRQDVPAAAGESHFNGMFLGAEKIWVGEPVRLRVPGDDIVVMIIHRLIEQSQPASTVTFVGDVYKFVEMPMTFQSRAEWPTNPDLPARMAADLRFRNEVADNVKKGTWCEWRLLEPAARRVLSDIKGRWYETQILLPILKGEAVFQQEISQGIANDVSRSMNGRGDGHTPQSFRKANRKATFGQAVPEDFAISRGLDGLPADDIFPMILE